MIKKITLVAGIFSLSLSNIAQADCSSHYCNNVKVTHVVAYPGEDIVHVSTDATESQLTSCTPLNSIYLTLNAGDIGGERTYSALLTALATEKMVAIAFVSGVTNCTIENVLLYQ